ncbi:MAG: hypothetical protein ACE5GW_13045, partial [Planctomycetota bacterium]
MRRLPGGSWRRLNPRWIAIPGMSLLVAIPLLIWMLPAPSLPRLEEIFPPGGAHLVIEIPAGWLEGELERCVRAISEHLRTEGGILSARIRSRLPSIPAPLLLQTLPWRIGIWEGEREREGGREWLLAGCIGGMARHLHALVGDRGPRSLFGSGGPRAALRKGLFIVGSAREGIAGALERAREATLEPVESGGVRIALRVAGDRPGSTAAAGGHLFPAGVSSIDGELTPPSGDCWLFRYTLEGMGGSSPGE